MHPIECDWIDSKVKLYTLPTDTGGSARKLLQFTLEILGRSMLSSGRLDAEMLPVLLAATPYVHRCDLMSAMFGHHLRNCYLFADTGEAFLRQLTASLEYTIFFPGNYIVTEGNSEARMYWVTSGTVSVLSVRSDLTETTHEKLGPGDVFGILQGLTRGIVHVFSYRAETNVSILTLSLEAWANILQFFPEAQNVIFERSEFLFTQIDM